MSGTETDCGDSRPGGGTLVFVLKRLNQSACGSVALESMPVSTRAGQSTSSAMSTDTNSPSSDVFLRSKGTPKDGYHGGLFDSPSLWTRQESKEQDGTNRLCMGLYCNCVPTKNLGRHIRRQVSVCVHVWWRACASVCVRVRKKLENQRWRRTNITTLTF